MKPKDTEKTILSLVALVKEAVGTIEGLQKRVEELEAKCASMNKTQEEILQDITATEHPHIFRYLRPIGCPPPPKP